MKNVSIYTTPTCKFCIKAKEFFKEKNVEYTEFDVSTDEEKKQEMIQKSGQMGVPVILISDTENPETQAEMVIGFDEEKLSQLLGL
jgi:glutaredoxin 3